MNSHFDKNKPVAIGSDHAGFDYKEDLISFLEAKEIHYHDFGHPVSSSVENEEASFGILICGSANGVAITANKHQGIRAAVCWGEELAQLSRLHNNANIICIP